MVIKMLKVWKMNSICGNLVDTTLYYYYLRIFDLTSQRVYSPCIVPLFSIDVLMKGSFPSLDNMMS